MDHETILLERLLLLACLQTFQNTQYRVSATYRVLLTVPHLLAKCGASSE